MFKPVALIFPALLAFSAIPAMAGGGLIYLSSQQLGPQVYLVTATVQKEDYSPCANCKTEFFVQDLHPSKYVINALSDKTDNEGKVSAKIALTTGGSATVTYYAKSQLPTLLYQSSVALLYFQQGSDTVPVYPTPDYTAPTYAPEPSNSPLPAPSSNPKIDELQNKLDDLQNKLQQSQKKQSFLEAQLNNIVNFLKSIFPFWK